MSSQAVGRAGEEFARAYVESLGYAVLGCNLRFGRREIDILAMDGDVLVVIEVKTRLSEEFGMPQEQISWAKLRSLSQLASRVSAIHRGANVRVDVVAIKASGLGPHGLIDPSLSHVHNITS
jgi:putative endonuclease